MGHPGARGITLDHLADPAVVVGRGSHQGLVGHAEHLALGGEQQNLIQQKLNQEAQYSQMPMNWLMQLVTGTTPAGAPQGGGFNWGSLLGGLGQAGGNYVLDMANTGGQKLLNPLVRPLTE